jgi:hypothetical protein
VICIKKLGNKITCLSIHTSDLEDVALKDFLTLFDLMCGMGIDENASFEDFSLQCANWRFTPRQPTWE